MSDSARHSVKAPNELLVAQRIANISDTAIRIPFTRFRVGLDFLIGLIPGIGDAIMFIVALSIIFLGWSIGLPKALIFKMMRNSVLDFLLGLIPLLGDVVDAFFKSNLANVRIMERWWVEQNKANLDSAAQQQLQNWEESNR